jgi:RND family efflux transporter MFP subunit
MEMSCLLSMFKSSRTNKDDGMTAFLLAGLCLLILLFGQSAWAQSYDAFLEPNQLIDISAPVRDRIAKLHVKEGETVKAGQLLAELDAEVLKARLASSEEAAAVHGRIDSARALVTMQTNRQQMLQELEKSGNARPQEMLTAQTDLAMAKAQLQNALDEQQLKKLDARIIEAQIEEKKLRAPVDGVVVKIYKQQAELIGESDQHPLMTLAQLDPLQALFHLPPGDAAQLQVQQAVTLVAVDKEVAGVVHFIAPIINAQSGTVEVRIQVANQQNALVSGSRCQLILNNSSGEPSHEKRAEQAAAGKSPVQ